jgi:hypothetical protein
MQKLFQEVDAEYSLYSDVDRPAAMKSLTFSDSDMWETRDFDDASSEEATEEATEDSIKDATEDATEKTTDEAAGETVTIRRKGDDYTEVSKHSFDAVATH